MSGRVLTTVTGIPRTDERVSRDSVHLRCNQVRKAIGLEMRVGVLTLPRRSDDEASPLDRLKRRVAELLQHDERGEEAGIPDSHCLLSSGRLPLP
jgi:hypothetical protein